MLYIPWGKFHRHCNTTYLPACILVLLPLKFMMYVTLKSLQIIINAHLSDKFYRKHILKYDHFLR